ncbi:outer membrane protein [Burkholderia multivorans]
MSKQGKWRAIRGNKFGVLCILLVCAHAGAQTRGSTELSVGWLHIMPQGNADPLTVVNAGGMPINQPIPQSGAHPGTSDAVGLTIEHYLTDHVGVALLAGSPFREELIGDGSFRKYGVLGTTRPMPPAVEVRYHFFSADAKLRPYVGLGVNYTWFTQTRVTNGAFVADSYGPGGSARATLSPSWNPVFEVGARYAVAKHWSLGVALAYVPVESNLTAYGTTANGVQVVSRTKLRIHPLNTLVSVSYAF